MFDLLYIRETASYVEAYFYSQYNQLIPGDEINKQINNLC